MDEQQLQEIEKASTINGSIPVGAKVITRTLTKELRRLQAENARLQANNEELATMLGVILDQVDYTANACGPTEMVGAVLDKRVIVNTRQILDKQWKEYLERKSTNDAEI